MLRCCISSLIITLQTNYNNQNFQAATRIAVHTSMFAKTISSTAVVSQSFAVDRRRVTKQTAFNTTQKVAQLALLTVITVPQDSPIY